MRSQQVETIHSLIEGFKKNRGHVSETAKENYKSRLGLFEKFCTDRGVNILEDWTCDVSDEYLNNYLRTRGDLRPNTNGGGIKGLSAESIKTHYATLRSLASYGMKTRRIQHDPTGHYARGAFKVKDNEEDLDERALSEKEVAQLFDGVRDMYKDIKGRGGERDAYLAARNEAIVALMLATGMRRGEIISAQVKHLDMDEQSLKFIGKGGRAALVWFDDKTAMLLRKYLDQRERVRTTTDCLFTTYSGGPMTESAIRRVFRYLKERTGIEDFRAHNMRHTYITHKAQHETNPYIVQQLARHKSLNTTLRYMHLTPEARAAARRTARTSSLVSKLA